ncbi:hypothetical protein [Treponema sp.]|uniref:hypothetical protein n=1 Tax=Treponema sp. TaxID=166 RepID=UPI003F03CD34
MKFIASIKIFAAYIALILLGVCTGAFLYMTHSLCTVLVAGQRFSAFSLAYFMKGVVLSLPMVLLLCPLFVSFYLIRHKEIPWYSSLVCMILHLALWIFFIPAAAEKLTLKTQAAKTAPEASLLSPGYFRMSENGRYILYYSETGPGNLCSGVCIDTVKSSGNVFTFTGEKPASFQNGFSDPLIRNTVEMPVILENVLKYFQRFISEIYFHCSGNFAGWLAFSSIILVFVSSVLVRNVSAWRLVNVLFILMGCSAVFFMDFYILEMNGSFFEKIPFPLKDVSVNLLLMCAANLLVCVAAFVLWLVSRRDTTPAVFDSYGDDI